MTLLNRFLLKEKEKNVRRLSCITDISLKQVEIITLYRYLNCDFNILQRLV